MFRFNKLVVGSFVMVLLVSTFAVGQNYQRGAKPMTYRISELTVTDSAKQNSMAFDMNDRGEIVGQVFATADQSNGFILDNAGTVKKLAAGTNFQSSGRKVNSLGDVAGYVFGNGMASRAFRWNAATGISVLTLGEQSQAFSINSTGDTVGTYRLDGKLRSFLWNRFGATYDLGMLDNSTFASTTAYAVNDSQQVVGTATSSDGYMHAFVWNPGLQLEQLFPGSQNSMAMAISNTGRIAGSLQVKNGSWKAFIYDIKSGETALYGPQNGVSIAYGINESGAAVGQSDGKAVLFLSLKAYDLNTMVEGGTPWTLTAANSINNNGQIVVAGTQNGITRSFLLTPIQ
jgi:probable HAF family extracellular repeat protein